MAFEEKTSVSTDSQKHVLQFYQLDKQRSVLEKELKYKGLLEHSEKKTAKQNTLQRTKRAIKLLSEFLAEVITDWYYPRTWI
ncbi:MAG: hypothetical protein JSC188_000340 [Candidatus Tokpelaia sp. JSC188]|nr:MAG: hypothetical protein JSC188_000340 [Candidatus Tokpelaia sp. JSC188]